MFTQQKNKEDRDNIRSTVVNYDDDASHGMGETKMYQSRMRNASPARASGSPHLLVSYIAKFKVIVFTLYSFAQ